MARTVEKELYLDLILSPREAVDGGLFPVTVPVIEPCPCCRGYGRIKTKREFGLSTPPHVKHGTGIKLSLEDIRIKKSNLNITVLIDPSLEQEE